VCRTILGFQLVLAQSKERRPERDRDGDVSTTVIRLAIIAMCSSRFGAIQDPDPW
jgi:hypothetical protein